VTNEPYRAYGERSRTMKQQGNNLLYWQRNLWYSY